MKVNSTMSVLFYLNGQKADDDGKTPIYCRITINGKRTPFSTGHKVNPKHWISKASMVDKADPDAIYINEDLDTVKGNLRRVFNQLTAIYDHVTGEMVRLSYSGKGNEVKTILDVFKVQLAKLEKAVAAKKASLKTKQRMQNIHTKFKAFLKHEYKVSDKPLVEFKASLGEELKEYFSIECNYCDNTVYKYISIIKELFDYAVDKEWLEKNPIKKFKCPYKNPHRQVLTMIELEQMMSAKMTNPFLERVRDIYIFSCFTGYAYKEVNMLTKDNIIIGMDGNKWISLIREKADEPELVPLLPVPLQILEKYKDDVWANANNKLLPVRSNQKYNQNLKQIAKDCKINKHLTTHTARHTFATTVTLENDVPLETVSKLLGHRSIKTTQIYAKISLKKLSNNMGQLKEKLSDKEFVLKSRATG